MEHSMRKAVLLVFFLPLIFVSCATIKRPNNYNTGIKADAIVVLGYTIDPDGTASFIMDNRVAMAVYLFKKELATKMILSGGAKVKRKSEAELMKTTAVELGISPDKIILEEESATTYSNAKYVIKIAAEMNMKKLLVVSDWLQLKYAVPLFRRLGKSKGIEIFWCSVNYDTLVAENLITYPTRSEFERIKDYVNREDIGPFKFRPSKNVRR
jgi:uncharacterized SAM-binding protein YcdF (DUF218 family)